eukprot:5620617-Prymnesium_polylepis.1
MIILAVDTFVQLHLQLGQLHTSEQSPGRAAVHRWPPQKEWRPRCRVVPRDDAAERVDPIPCPRIGPGGVQRDHEHVEMRQMLGDGGDERPSANLVKVNWDGALLRRKALQATTQAAIDSFGEQQRWCAHLTSGWRKLEAQRIGIPPRRSKQRPMSPTCASSRSSVWQREQGQDEAPQVVVASYAAECVVVGRRDGFGQHVQSFGVSAELFGSRWFTVNTRVSLVPRSRCACPCAACC